MDTPAQASEILQVWGESIRYRLPNFPCPPATRGGNWHQSVSLCANSVAVASSGPFPRPLCMKTQAKVRREFVKESVCECRVCVKKNVQPVLGSQRLSEIIFD
jgi:hypothetical protein